ncbi:PadR family transcriptional regulator [Phycicoccus sp. HDW14]|uniref:PadR family transcriptional regulator n=1 Tax=Phycicoccus sp. HDW14 TaxID=2714941 RepID=UPI00140C8A80|nr:PadR family transcriptional regulator [Phycicoccus sp. HDW14]QIM22615.1 PadR family transcriptional regulator [Phycicoccus sp. HDW14]
MSVRLGLMALLAEGDSYGARLRSDFEERTGGTWPLNVGQVYTTLERLVRDGLVEQTGEADAEGRIAYRLTTAGHTELGTWWTTPVDRTNTPRDELTIKLALAVTAPGVDVHRVVQSQRTSTLRQLRDLTRLKRDALDRAEGTAEGARDAEHGLAWLLVLENLVFAAEAEVRWLDHVESVLARHARDRQARDHRSTPVDGTAADPEHDHAGTAPAAREGTPA